MMVFTVGICDDCPEQIELLIKYLTLGQAHCEFKIIYSTLPEEFLAQLALDKPQLVFLDIDMPKMSGIRLGEKIKGLFEDIVIIYITAHERYALEAFRVRAFHYLLKPLTKDKFNQVLEEAVSVLKKDKESKPVKTFTVQIKGEIICLNYSDIIYFEKIARKIKIYTKDRNIYYYDKFFNLIEKIDAASFVQCHQGYIVNVDKITGLKDKILFLEDKLMLPVSRSFTENIKEMLAKRLFAGKETS